MACFITPTTAAIILTVIRKKVPAKHHINWLITMLWGGSVMLLAEHIALGEVVWHPPWLTAGWAAAGPEIVFIGGLMTMTVVAVWGVMVLVAGVRERKKQIMPT